MIQRLFVAVPVVLGLALGAAAIYAKVVPMRLNLTDSVPIGLYRVMPRAAYAGICLDASVIAPALQAGVDLPPGECPNSGRVPILKTIYRATPDNPITFSAAGFTVAGILKKNTVAKRTSRTGRPLTHAPFGTYTSGLWAISDFNRDSYDSRYFGPVPESAVLFYAAPFLLF